VLLTAAQAEHGAKLKYGRDLRKVAAADQRSSQTGEIALPRGREAPEERLGDDEPEHGIADKLKLLVIGAGLVWVIAVAFIGQRTVRQRQLQKVRILELVSEKAVLGGGVPGTASGLARFLPRLAGMVLAR
jgi:hypothetical protein